MCTSLGLSKSLMTDLKSGRKKGISAETAQKIASYFGVSVGYLLGLEEQKENAPTGIGERDILEDVDIGFYQGFKDLDESDKEVLRDMVRIMRERRTRKEEK